MEFRGAERFLGTSVVEAPVHGVVSGASEGKGGRAVATRTD